MTVANFAFTNQAPESLQSDVDNIKTLNSGYDICFMVVGDFSNINYNMMSITMLEINTPYSIHLGFFWLSSTTPLNDIIDSKRVGLYTAPDNVLVVPTLAVVGKGIKREAFGVSEHISEREVPARVPAVGLFRRKRLYPFKGWSAKVKSYSYNGRFDYNLPFVLKFPDKEDERKAYLMILIGAPPTETSTLPIYVRGQLYYSVDGEEL